MSPDPGLRVVVDLRVLDRPGMQAGGLGRYSLEVLAALERVRPEWQLLVHSNRFGGSDSGAARRLATRWPTQSAPGRIAWLHAGAIATKRLRPDVWFSPTFVLPGWWRGPAVVAVHDLVFDLLPDRYRGRLNATYARLATRRSARRADRVLCGSSETAKHLAERWQIDPGRLVVTPYGVSEVFREQPVTDPGERERFVLVVGSLEARKGIETLRSALDALDAGGRRPRLVLAGQRGWGVAGVLEELLGRSDVEFIERPDDAELAALYRRAAALVYPSRMEGFGLPVAEALASGCPVIASDLACVREFAGDAVVYVPVGNSDALARAIEGLLADERRSAALSREGVTTVADLNWEAAAAGAAGAIEAAVEARRTGSAGRVGHTPVDSP